MADKSKCLSIIDKGFKVEGTIHAKGKLIVNGELEGTLIGDTVVMVDGSRIHGQARVQQILIAGEFEGDIVAFQSLKISHTGNFWGKIVCRSIIVEAGGKLNGSVRPLESKDEVLKLEANTQSEVANVIPSSPPAVPAESDKK
ncbi:MAG: polymer-forming cytoskeletal protein [Desulfobacterales bacterium]|nr:polymer-forming cytoskeletal protein [Desulfobacterales bacterium]